MLLSIFIAAVLAVAAAAFAVLMARRNRHIDETDRSYKTKVSPRFAAIPAALALAVVAVSCLYAQDAGQVVVLRNFGGSIAGSTQEAGFHAKAPWQDVISYDVRNNVISFVGDSGEDYTGGSANGPDVTVNDSGGTAADVDVQVNYSLDPNMAVQIYQDYGTQENFVRAIAAVDLRSVPREVAGRFDTITMLTDRGQFTTAIQDELSKKWEQYGLQVTQVSVQDVRYPQEVIDRYSAAQSAQVAQQQAAAEQETARIQAETKVIEAQGEADANAVLAASLTPEVIQQRYIDALKDIGASGNLVVVPEGSQPIVGASK